MPWLLGRTAWYAPGFLRRFHDRFGLSESAPEPAPAAGPVPVGRAPYAPEPHH
ncbi:putative drug exporter of the RND superfamily [Actinacidiphila alni]|uniref:Putative drug exporter of the RND superfamily n=1 Tax=Actinacidiphila alni TaxID=380248 RepID=A0A1I1XHJ4_9ACTN|nr:hypothetical protein [Actinacidiphila alni]SFE06661.1 putative drug exporter of the RND superfamily [Actinacidiphila alni]